MYNNNIGNFQESTTIVNACTKKSGNLLKASRKYLRMTDVYTAALLPTYPSLDDDSGFRHSFETEASLLLTQRTPTVTHDIIRRCWIDVAVWYCHIHAEAVRALSWIYFMYFLLFDGESVRLVKRLSW